MNKYEQTPEHIIDLHGYTTAEAKLLLDTVFAFKKFSHVRVITGKSTYRGKPAVLLPFVKRYVLEHGVDFRPAKPQDGGEGALEVFLK